VINPTTQKNYQLWCTLYIPASCDNWKFYQN